MRGVLLLLVVGCGMSYDEFQDERIDALCEQLTRCKAVANVDDCTAWHRKSELDNPNVPAAIDAGKLTYDEDAANACLDALRDLACDVTQQPMDALDACYEVLTGTVPAGGACGFSQECESDNCVKLECGMACCAGMCGPPRMAPGIDEPCLALCADGAYCGIDSVCHPYGTEGQPCGNYAPCGYGLYCAGDLGDVPGVCTALPQLGEPCEELCADVNAGCIAGICATTGLAGDPCDATSYCATYYTCTDAGTCGAYPTRGMACSGSCSDESYCGEQGVCIALKGDGMSCVQNDECSTHFCGPDDRCGPVPLCI